MSEPCLRENIVSLGEYLCWCMQEYGGSSLLAGATAYVGSDAVLAVKTNYFYTGDYANHTLLLAAAMDYVGTLGGGSISLEAMTFNGRLVVDEDEVLVFGQGWDTIINETVETGNAIYVTGDRCVIRDLQCGTAPTGGNLYNGIESTGDDLLVDNVFVNGSDDVGILLGAPRNRVTNCYIYNTDFQGIVVGDAGDNAVISNNLISTTGNDGITINAPAENCVVEGNYITGWTGEPVDDNSDSSVVADNNCGGDVMNSKGCAFLTVQASIDHLAGGGWVEVPGRTFAEAVTIANAGVVLRGASWSSTINGGTTGHAVEISAAECMVRDIEVRTTQAGTNNYDGIHVTNVGQGTRIINVEVGASDRYGIYIDKDLCVVEKCFITNIDEVGVFLDDEADTTLIIDNHFHQIGTDGISVNSADNVIIGSNYINICGSDGIQLATADNCHIEGNTILATTTSDINISNAACDGTRVGSNVLTGAAVCIIDAGTATELPTKIFQFIQGTTFISADGSAKGWEINAEADMAVALGQLPLEVQQVVRFKIWGVALGAPVGGGGQMHLDIVVQVGADDAAYTTENISLANFDSVTTDYVNNDVVHWSMDSGDDADIGDLVGGMSLECKINGGTAAAPDGATNATFRALEIEYV